jgi:hypothetical protein
VSGVNFPAYTGTSLEAVDEDEAGDADEDDADDASDDERGYDPETLRSITTMERYS